jgi:hypothetical protein
MGLKGVDGVAGQPAGPRAIQEGGNGMEAAEAAAEIAAEDQGDADRMPGALESAEGGAPEVMVHKETALAEHRDELSPEEQAIQMGNDDAVADDKATVIDDEPDIAALAEGRVEPPSGGQENR